MRLSRQRGQHTAEFALLIGIAAVVAVALQHLVQKALRAGVASVTDAALGAPDCLDTDGDGACDCFDPDHDGQCDGDETLVDLRVQASGSRDSQGDTGFRRKETALDTVIGHSVTHDVTVRSIPDLTPP